jgi:MFS transporter, PAT family, beta-lactamase induction signal transducer AmpG
MASALTTPFLLDLGFSRAEVGAVSKAFGLAGTIAGVLLGGGVVARLGINRSLWVFAILQALSNLGFTVLAMVGKSHGVLVTSVAIENLCGGMGTAGFVAFLMSQCDKRFTATQYALLTSLMGLTRVLAGVPTGYMVGALGWPLFFTISVFGAVPAMLLLPRFAPWRQEVQLVGRV